MSVQMTFLVSHSNIELPTMQMHLYNDGAVSVYRGPRNGSWETKRSWAPATEQRRGDVNDLIISWNRFGDDNRVKAVEYERQCLDGPLRSILRDPWYVHFLIPVQTVLRLRGLADPPPPMAPPPLPPSAQDINWTQV